MAASPARRTRRSDSRLPSATVPGTLSDMRVFGSRRPVTVDTPLDGVQESRPRNLGELSRAEVQSNIDRALRILDARRTAGGYREQEVQVVVQVCPAGEQYARWRKERNRLMARSSKRWGTQRWPERLSATDVGIVLLPYPPGRVGPALGSAKIVAEPLLSLSRCSSMAAPRRAPLSSCSRCRPCGCGCTRRPMRTRSCSRRLCLRSFSARGHSDARCWTAARRRGRWRHPTVCSPRSAWRRMVTEDGSRHPRLLRAWRRPRPRPGQGL